MKYKNLYSALFIAAAIFTSCSDDDTPKQGETPQKGAKYLITATPKASEGVADYILTTDNLSQGKISTVGNGIEQDGTYRYYVTSNNKFFSLLYGQGNPGAVTTYQLNNKGTLDKLSNFQSETVQAFAPVKDDLLLMKISRSSDSPIASWYRLDTRTSQFVAEGQINTKDLANKENGELAFFTWVTQVDDYVYLPYYTIKGNSTDRFGTAYPNEANIAVYSYPEMEYVKTIHDDRTSHIGRYFNNGLSVDEKGDAYAFSSSIATTNGEITSTKPSAITRIKKGETAFDQTFYYNIEEASGNRYITSHLYLGNGKFLVNLHDTASKGTYSTGKDLAIVDVYAKTLTDVTGLPTKEDIESIASKGHYVSKAEGIVYIGITTKTGSYVYNIDATTAKATQGIEVEGGTITAISKLNPVK